MNKNNLKLTSLALALIFTFSNCATIVSKSSYPVMIHTDPKGATVQITDKKGKEVYRGSSPALVRLNAGAGYFSKAEYQVKISMNGYDAKVVPILFKVNGWYFGNLLIGGLIGMLIVDPATGAMWKIDTPGIQETLTRSVTPLTINEPVLKIIDVKDVPQQLKDNMIRIK